MDDRYSDDTSVASADANFLPDATPGMKQNVTEDGGVTKECLVEGEGTQRPPKGARVQVQYVGTLEDGTEFDRSQPDDPFEFELGASSVIRAWDLGVATMRRGEKSVLTCAAEYAYGESGSPPVIPPNATLKFEVELLSWVDTKDISEARDGSLVKRIVTPPEKWDKPAYEAVCTVTVATVEGAPAVALEKGTVTMGDDEVPAFLEKTLETMAEGEACEVTAAAGLTGTGGPATYKVQLHSFVPAASRWNLGFPERLVEAEKRKVQGNERYKLQKVAQAVRKYEKGLEYLSDEHDASDADKKAAKAVKLPLLTNLAAAQLFLKQYAAVVEKCTEALGLDSVNAKALLRRAKANVALDNWIEARADLGKILEANPKDAEAAAELAKLKQKMKAQNQKDKRLFSNMFSRMQDDEPEKKASPADEGKEEKVVP